MLYNVVLHGLLVQLLVQCGVFGVDVYLVFPEGDARLRFLIEDYV